MSGKIFKSVVLFFVGIMIVCSSQAFAARLAQGEYAVTNGSFEDTNSLSGCGWYSWLGDPDNAITIIIDPNKSYYGFKSAALYRDTGNTVLFQEINVVTSGDGPKAGDAVEAGVWVMFDSAAAGDSSGQVVIQVKYVVGSTPTVITSSAYIQNKQADKWYYILTETDELSNGRQIPANAEKIQIVVDSWATGTVYVDFAQCGKVGSITGNPSKIAMAEYHTWFGVPDYLPNPRKFTDPNYTGFAGYDRSGWRHWEWNWDPDGGYNSDPAFYEQIGFCSGCKYENVSNTGFESDGYGTSDWSKYAPSGGTNERTNEKAYESSYSVKFINPDCVEECSAWQWFPAYVWNNPTGPNVPNARERIMASMMVNFADVNLADGRFWIQVLAQTNSGDKLIAKSYEYISPEFIEQNKDTNGWVQIQTRPVQKAAIPDETTGLVVAVKFYYKGTIYIDKVEIGEAEYSNIQRQTASTKHPKPKIGPYDSTDDELIDYHLDLCKAMLFDVMLVDYYGHQFAKEDYQRIALGKLMQKIDDRDMKVCVFYEPKVHLLEWGDVKYYTDMTNVSEMNAVDTAKVNAYIDDVTEYNNVGEIGNIGLVKHYIKMAAIQDDIKYILQTWGNSKSCLTYRGKPVVAIFGMDFTAGSQMTQQDWKDIYDNLTVHDNTLGFIFMGDSAPSQNPADWFDVFKGMMNWYLVDENVQDIMFPTQQDIYNRSKDIINGRSVTWAQAGQGRFAVGLTYPQFNNIGVGGWAPVLEGGVWNYYIDRTPNWNGGFYRNTNQGVLDHVNDIDWVVVATFNDWNEGTSVEPSVEDGYLYPIITQDFIEDFKGIANEPNDLMQQITEKFINTHVKMDVDTSIEKKQPDPADMKTYYTLLIYQFDGSGNYLGELTLLDWSCVAGIFTSNFSGHHPDLSQYEPCFRISTQTGKGWVKLDNLSTNGWSENFSSVSNWLAFEGTSISTNGSVALLKDASDGSGGARWTGARLSYTSGDTMTLSVDNVYIYGTGKYYSGAACLKMVLDYEGFNTYTQDQLQAIVGLNELTDQDVCIDPRAMYLALNYCEIDSRYNYAYEKTTNLEDAYDMLCYWMAYDVPGVLPRPQKMPSIIPLNGRYMDWVVVNGYSTTDDPRTAASYTINGFWITDPDADGLGKNIYFTASALSNYYVPIVSDDTFNGYYVSIVEPPAVSCADVKIAEPKNFQGYKGDRKSMVAAAIAGLKDNVLKDTQFKSAYKDAKAGKPILVDNGKEYYCIVPFIKDGGCSVAVIIDAETGAFMQASYTDTPDSSYLKHFKKQKGGNRKHIQRRVKNAFLPAIENIYEVD